MNITGKHPTKINDPILKHPAMKGRRWQIDPAAEPHTSFKKLSKKQIDEFGVDNMDTHTDTKNNDVDISYREFYEDLKLENKLTGGVGDATAPHNVDPIELSMGQTVEMEHTTDPDVATEIALDHLSEDPHYYTKLRKAGLAKELDQVNASSGFGDPNHPINDKKRLGTEITCTAGNNIVGKIGNTPEGTVEGYEDEASIIDKDTEDFTVDVDIQDPELELEEDRCTDIAKRKYKKWPSAYACVPEKNTQALTKNGWKNVIELNLGDEILTHNLKLDILEFKPILNIHRYKNADTITVQSGNNGFIFECTKNHKWVIKLPEISSDKSKKFKRINLFSLIETEEILKHKNNKLLVVTAPYESGISIKKNKIYKYGDNWVEYILNIDSGQRQSWLFSAIVYDGNQQKTQRLTDNINNINKLEWEYDGNYGKQSFGFKQKDIMHRDAFLLSAFLNNGIATWKKTKNKEIYSCHYTANKRYKNTENFKLISENKCDVWCPETENGTWVMKQEINNNGIITITGNSGAVVRCRKGKIWRELEEAELEERFDKEKKQGLHGWFARKGGKGGKGWVDCNTCRKDKKTGRKTCKSCGRQAGEKRSKYPACRPTPAQCNKTGTRRKKGPKNISWKKKNESINYKAFFENSEMSQSDLTKIIDYSEKLQSMFDANDNLEDWVKAKLNHACDYVATVRDYLKFYRDEKESIDELLNEVKEIEKKYKNYNSVIDAIQYALDIVGLEQTFGSIADASNSVISLLRAALAKEKDEKKKHLLNSAISAVSIIPFGDLAKLIKLRHLRKPAVKLLKFVKKYLKSAKPSYVDELVEKWSNNYKKSINCSNPKGFSQKAHCRARQLRKAGIKTKSKSVKECYKEAVLELVREQNSSMAMGALKQLNNDAKELNSLFTAEDELEDWVKAKLNLAGEYLDDVYHHLDHFGPSGRKYEVK